MLRFWCHCVFITSRMPHASRTLLFIPGTEPEGHDRRDCDRNSFTAIVFVAPSSTQPYFRGQYAGAETFVTFKLGLEQSSSPPTMASVLLPGMHSLTSVIPLLPTQTQSRNAAYPCSRSLNLLCRLFTIKSWLSFRGRATCDLPVHPSWDL